VYRAAVGFTWWAAWYTENAKLQLYCFPYPKSRLTKLIICCYYITIFHHFRSIHSRNGAQVLCTFQAKLDYKTRSQSGGAGV
jgi:hypothetical protein